MLVVIVPAYNEAERIGRVLRDLFEHDCKNVLVVDDGSSDATARVAKEAGAAVIRHALNRGQGAALETGNEWARQQGAEVVVHFDGDGQHEASDIAPAIAVLREHNLDAVLGSRFLGVRSRVPFLKRVLILPVSRLVNYIFTGVLLSDAHNGFRVLGSRSLHSICIRQDGMAHNSEIVAELKARGFRFAEVPVRVTYHEFGQGIEGGIKIIWNLILSYL